MVIVEVNLSNNWIVFWQNFSPNLAVTTGVGTRQNKRGENTSLFSLHDFTQTLSAGNDPKASLLLDLFEDYERRGKLVFGNERIFVFQIFHDTPKQGKRRPKLSSSSRKPFESTTLWC